MSAGRSAPPRRDLQSRSSMILRRARTARDVTPLIASIALVLLAVSGTLWLVDSLANSTAPALPRSHARSGAAVDRQESSASLPFAPEPAVADVAAAEEAIDSPPRTTTTTVPQVSPTLAPPPTPAAELFMSSRFDPWTGIASLPTVTVRRSSACDSAYPEERTCIPPGPPFDQGCAITSERLFEVLPPDPQRLDHDGDGIGCEPV
jgi:hypothetical protein